MSFNVSDRLRSFRYAGRGIAVLVATQHNAWIHAAATVAVLVASAALGLSSTDWCLIVVAFALVWSAEGMNTAVELLGDAASPDYHPLVEKAKDVSAGAVLLAAIGAAAIGLLVLGPPLLSHLR